MLSAHDLDLLRSLTAAPSIAGNEEPAIAIVASWAESRPHIRMDSDEAGNVLLTVGRPSLLVTAHLDHPGFVVTEAPGTDGTQPVEFRGGMREPYFADAELTFFTTDGPVDAVLAAFDHAASSGMITAEGTLPVGTVGRWRFAADDLGVRDGILWAPGCDDLAGVAAALTLLDRLGDEAPHVGVLLTRAEEVGFVGAIAACELGTIPADADVICLETSRALAHAPIGAGPVVRVGDAVSVFTPELTARIAAVAKDLDRPTQRKLMDGGACEATAFVAYGYRATCVCLPLGNYHNQGDLDRVEVGEGTARPAPEFISLDDYEGLVELLVAVATASDTDQTGLRGRLSERYRTQRHLLGRTMSA